MLPRRRYVQGHGDAGRFQDRCRYDDTARPVQTKPRPPVSRPVAFLTLPGRFRLVRASPLMHFLIDRAREQQGRQLGWNRTQFTFRLGGSRFFGCLDLIPLQQHSLLVEPALSPKTCGWRRISLLLMAAATSSKVKAPFSAAICACMTTCSSTSPNSSHMCGRSLRSMVCSSSEVSSIRQSASDWWVCSISQGQPDSGRASGQLFL